MIRKESTGEARERLRLEALREAGQACLDWAADMGECHLCGYDHGAGKPHDDECPLRRLDVPPITGAEFVDAIHDAAPDAFLDLDEPLHGDTVK